MREPLFLTGIGQDSHRLRPARGDELLHLGGLSFDCGLTTVANSDGDVVLHALFNALSTALGGGSIGPVGDQLCAQGVRDSREFLQPLLEEMAERGFRVSNVSVSIEAARPKFEPHREALATSIAQILLVDKRFVGVAATSGEKLTAVGQGEGIAVFASVLLEHQ